MGVFLSVNYRSLIQVYSQVWVDSDICASLDPLILSNFPVSPSQNCLLRLSLPQRNFLASHKSEILVVFTLLFHFFTY